MGYSPSPPPIRPTSNICSICGRGRGGGGIRACCGLACGPQAMGAKHSNATFPPDFPRVSPLSPARQLLFPVFPRLPPAAIPQTFRVPFQDLGTLSPPQGCIRRGGGGLGGGGLGRDPPFLLGSPKVDGAKLFRGSHCLLVCNVLSAPNPPWKGRRGGGPGGRGDPPPPTVYGHYKQDGLWCASFPTARRRRRRRRCGPPVGRTRRTTHGARRPSTATERGVSVPTHPAEHHGEGSPLCLLPMVPWPGNVHAPPPYTLLVPPRGLDQGARRSAGSISGTSCHPPSERGTQSQGCGPLARQVLPTWQRLAGRSRGLGL